MIRIFTSLNPIAVHSLREYLESWGIPTIVRGEDLSRVAGSVPLTECWTELLLLDESRLEEASARVREYHNSNSIGDTPRTCANCGEQIEGAFAECWRCMEIPLPVTIPASPTEIALGRFLARGLGAVAVFSGFYFILSVLFPPAARAAEHERSMKWANIGFAILSWIVGLALLRKGERLVDFILQITNSDTGEPVV